MSERVPSDSPVCVPTESAWRSSPCQRKTKPRHRTGQSEAIWDATTVDRAHAASSGAISGGRQSRKSPAALSAGPHPEVEGEETVWDGRYSSEELPGAGDPGRTAWSLPRIVLALATLGPRPSRACVRWPTSRWRLSLLYWLCFGFQVSSRIRRSSLPAHDTSTVPDDRHSSTAASIRSSWSGSKTCSCGRAWSARGSDVGTVILISSEQTLPKAVPPRHRGAPAGAGPDLAPHPAGTQDRRTSTRSLNPALSSPTRCPGGSERLNRSAGCGSTSLIQAEDSPLEVLELGEPGGLEQRDRLGAADAALAVNDDRARPGRARRGGWAARATG